MPKVSVIVPVYNADKYLRCCVEHIFVQSYNDYELLLINDGSTDTSGAICDEYGIRDSRVRVFHKLNGGVSSARNIGLENACGDYIIFLDSDDYWYTSTALERLVEVAENHNADIVRGDYKAVDIIEKNLFERSLTKAKKQYSNKIISSGEFYTKIISGENFLGVSLFRKSSIGSLRFNTDKSFLEDMEFYANILLQPLRCMFIPMRFYAYRILENSASHAIKIKNLADSFSMCAIFNDCEKKTKDKALQNAYRRNSIMMYYWTLCTLSEFFYPQRMQIIEDLKVSEIQMITASLADWKIFKFPLIVFLKPNLASMLLNVYIRTKRKAYTLMFGKNRHGAM